MSTAAGVREGTNDESTEYLHLDLALVATPTKLK